MSLIDKPIERAKRTPYYHLEGYMERYWLIKPNPKRWFFKDFSIRIHRILRSDTDDCFHDHPWASMSIILRGGYWELMPLKQSQHPRIDFYFSKHVWRKTGAIVIRKARFRHKIMIPSGFDCWSMFVMFRKTEKWGFYTRKGFVPHKEYLGIPESAVDPLEGQSVPPRRENRDKEKVGD